MLKEFHMQLVGITTEVFETLQRGDRWKKKIEEEFRTSYKLLYTTVRNLQNPQGRIKYNCA